jgi:beta-lactamase class A
MTGLVALGTATFVLAGCATAPVGQADQPSSSPTGTSGPDSSAAQESVSASAPTVASGTTSHTVAAAGSATSATPNPAQLKAQAQAQVNAQVSAKIAAMSAKLQPGSVSVAALNIATGATYSAGQSAGMWTASAYKLLVLETLLLQHQHSGTKLSGTEMDQSTTMIRDSDNEAGYDLFERIGGNAGLAAAVKQMGLTHTVPGRSDPTFTTTSASDYLILLKNLVTAGPLDAASRSYALGLMQTVQAGQRWGVGVIADPGTSFANKNGWLAIDNSNGPGENDNGKWAVNSVGIMTVHGQTVLMAVFTRHEPSYAAGVALVQSLATALSPTVSSSGT